MKRSGSDAAGSRRVITRPEGAAAADQPAPPLAGPPALGFVRLKAASMTADTSDSSSQRGSLTVLSLSIMSTLSRAIDITAMSSCGQLFSMRSAARARYHAPGMIRAAAAALMRPGRMNGQTLASSTPATVMCFPSTVATISAMYGTPIRKGTTETAAKPAKASRGFAVPDAFTKPARDEGGRDKANDETERRRQHVSGPGQHIGRQGSRAALRAQSGTDGDAQRVC